MRRLGTILGFSILLLLITPADPVRAEGDSADDLEAAATRAAASADPRDVGHGSLLLRPAQGDGTQGGGTLRAAPSLDTAVTLRVTGMIVRAEVEQRFHNPSGEWLEGVYVFPLPDDAAVDRLRMRIGDRLIEGEIQEKAEAKRTYERAKRSGQRASLVSQKRPNLFSTSVANIGPGETVEVTIAYQHDARYDNGRFQLRFPMAITPRYDNTPTALASVASLPAAVASTVATAALDARLEGAGETGPQTPGGAGPVRLRLELRPGLPLAKLGSLSHDLVSAKHDGVYEIELAAGEVAPDRDFVFEWQPDVGRVPEAVLLRDDFEGETYGLLMVLPPSGDDGTGGGDGGGGGLRLARETVFVIDVSGSMAGASIEQARGALLLALDRLEPQDHFNVIAFSSDTRSLFPASVPASGSWLEQARDWVRDLEADGGTEMMPALQAALADPGVDLGLRQVIFMTDGAVSGADALFALLEHRLGRSRLFTVGIGSAPNSHFMRRAAALGRGTFTFIGDPSAVAARMGELFRKLERPVLGDLEVRWADPNAETWPERVGDLYDGEPLVVAARLPSGIADVEISARRGQARWQRRLSLPGGVRAAGIDKLWARRKIAGLLDAAVSGRLDRDTVRAEVVALGLRHHLVSKFTSLVAVDRTPTKSDGTPRRERLPSATPAGSAMTGSALPKTATSARFWQLLAVALALAALILARGGTPRPRRRSRS